MGFVLVGLIHLAWTGGAMTFHASWRQAGMMTLSGVIGFFLCDLVLFRSYVLIGARLAQLMLCGSPIIAAVFGRLISGDAERLGWIEGVCMIAALAGVAIVIGQKRADETHAERKQFRAGVMMAMAGAVLYALSLPLAKSGKAAQEGEVVLGGLEANLIRIAGGMVLFFVFVPLTGRTKDTLRAMKDRGAMWVMLLGAVAGPVMGVTALMAATEYLQSGIVATITAMVPVTIIPVAIWIRKEKVTWLAVLGSLLAVGATAVLAWVQQ
jgi:drug/metabolite transporter (DMT)-like permease